MENNTTNISTESTSPSQPAQVTSPNPEMPEYDAKKIALLVVGVLIIVLIPASVYIYWEKTTSSDVVETIPVPARDPDMKPISENTSLSNITKYLSTVDRKIDAAQDKYTRDLYRLTKADLLALNWNNDVSKLVDNTTPNSTTATNIYLDLINENTAPTASSSYVRAFALQSLIRLHDECCTPVNGKNQHGVFNRPIAGFNDKYSEYLDKGIPAPVAKLMSLNDLLALTPTYFKNDISYRRNSLDVKSRILFLYGSKLDKETRDSLLAGLEDDLAGHGSYQPLTSKSPVVVTAGYSVMHAFAFDTYHQWTGDYKKYNSEIDDNYEEINSLTSDNSGIQLDPTILNVIKYYNILRFISSTNLRYGKDMDADFEKKLIDDYLDIINSSPEVQRVAKNNYLSEDFKNGSLKSSAYVMSLRPKYPELDDYFTSIGL